jgi:hypothetical protein
MDRTSTGNIASYEVGAALRTARPQALMGILKRHSPPHRCMCLHAKAPLAPAAAAAPRNTAPAAVLMVKTHLLVCPLVCMHSCLA